MTIKQHESETFAHGLRLKLGDDFFLSSGGVGPILFPASGVYDIPGVVFILTNVAVQAPHPRPASYTTVAAQALPVSWLLPPPVDTQATLAP